MSQQKKTIKTCIQSIQKHPIPFEGADSKAAIDSLQARYLEELTQYTENPAVLDAIKTLSHSTFSNPPAEADPIIARLNKAIALKKAAILNAAVQQDTLNQNKAAHDQALQQADTVLENHYNWVCDVDIPSFTALHTQEDLARTYDLIMAQLEAAYNSQALIDAKALLGLDHESVEQAEEVYEVKCNELNYAQSCQSVIIKQHQSILEAHLDWLRNFQPIYQGSFTINGITRQHSDFLTKLRQYDGSQPDSQLQVAYTFFGKETKTEAYLDYKHRIDDAVERCALRIEDGAGIARKKLRLEKQLDIPNHEAFVVKMYELEQKIKHMKEETHRDKYAAAIGPAEWLHDLLKKARETYLTSEDTESKRLSLFKASCLKAMDSEKTPEILPLTKHRDWNQFIANFVGWVLTIATAGLFAPVAYGLGLFSRTTDTMSKVYDIRNTVNEMESSHLRPVTLQK